MVLVIDNYDSFVYNLVQAILPLGFQCEVRRNDAITTGEVEALAPSHLIVSPGPCTPDEAGVSTEAIRRLAGRAPVLGVCLGHQCLGVAFGGRIARAEPVHGKTSAIHHEGAGLFAGLPRPFEAARYHSLVVDRAGLPDCLEVTAWTADGLIMGLQHRTLPAVYGVQFHPESYMSADGPALIRAFLDCSAGG